MTKKRLVFCIKFPEILSLDTRIFEKFSYGDNTVVTFERQVIEWGNDLQGSLKLHLRSQQL
jgi:hypothetical protein